MKIYVPAIVLCCLALTACGSSEPPPAPTPTTNPAQAAKPKLGYTIAEFDAAVEKLYGASPEEVMKKFGKPRGYDRNSDGTEQFAYSGVEDPVTGMLSSSTYLGFQNGKLKPEKPTHYF